ncbi:hypothetical protein ABK040_012553 [Willaertia magna]
MSHPPFDQNNNNFKRMTLIVTFIIFFFTITIGMNPTGNGCTTIASKITTTKINNKINNHKIININTTRGCYGCVLFVELIESFINTTTTVNEVIKIATKICPYLDPEIRAVCPLLIEQMGPEIVEVILERENPQVVCTTLHFCNATTAVTTIIGKNDIPETIRKY